MNKKIVHAEIRIYRKTKVWSQILFLFLNEIVEAVASTYGSDMPREDTIQALWLFVLLLLPKIKLRGKDGKPVNVGAYIYTCLRHYVHTLRTAIDRQKMISLEEINAI